MRLLLVSLLCLFPVIGWAALTVVTDQSSPGEIVPTDLGIGETKRFLGELTGSPIMYEVSSDQSFILTAQLRQPTNQLTEPLAAIVVRQNDRGGGVTEVGRISAEVSAWQRSPDAEVGLTFLDSPQLQETVEPGVYRIEVSTPENSGRYLLQLSTGESDEAGYVESLQAARVTQQFFGYGLFSMLQSRLIYQPLLLFIGLLIIFKSTRYWLARKATSHVSA